MASGGLATVHVTIATEAELESTDSARSLMEPSWHMPMTRLRR